jgi:two-component system sensor histidine kinase VanS
LNDNMNLTSFRMKIIVYSIISGLITMIVEVFLITNMAMISEFMKVRNYSSNQMPGENSGNLLMPGREVVFQVLFLIIVGIIIFLISFILLTDGIVKYMKEITTGIQKISEGRLDTRVEVRGNDEFAIVAKNLNQMTDEIKELMKKERMAEKSKNELITNVAHDLRTPLTSVIGYLELLSSKRDLEEETRMKYLNVAYNKSKRLEKLIEDLFGFTKLNFGKITMKVSTVDIVKLLSQLLEEFYPSLEEHHMYYELNTSFPSVKIEADGNLLARLFDNLINNAIKYGSHGKIVRVNIEKEEEFVVVSVINYGYVIPEEELQNIFKKFYRIEQSRSENTGGTGLGLAISKSIVEMHKGTIKVTSDLKGTVFQVKLPISETKEEIFGI